jgi:hypothetical protein
MLEQYRQKHHGQDPLEIVVAPAAVIALGATKALSTHFSEIPVRCHLFQEIEVVPSGKRLGVFAKRISENEIRIVSCDLP